MTAVIRMKHCLLLFVLLASLDLCAQTAPSAGGASGNQVNVSLVPNRTVGVAPLAVFFDATGTTAPSVTSQPFRDLRYAWNFGDPAGGATWRTSGRSKNAAEGPVAAHVFESPGTYDVTLTVFDGTSSSNVTQRIVVRNPDAFYVGASTFCIANAVEPDWAGCPPGATRVAGSADFSQTIRSYLATHRRLLFRRGDSWTNSSAAMLDVNGPWTIGAFGDGAKPVVRRAGGDMILQVGSIRSSHSDARVMDLDLQGGSDARTHCVWARGTFNKLLFLRLDCQHARHSYLMDALNQRPVSVWEGVAIVDGITTNMTGPGSIHYFITGRNLAVLGNTSTGADAEHIYRSMFMERGVISENVFANPFRGKFPLVVRSPEWSQAYGSTIPVYTPSQYVVISGNKLDTGTQGATSALAIADDNTHDQRARHFLIERNWVTGGTNAATGMWVNASYSSIRNNILDFSASAWAAGLNCIHLLRNAFGGQPGPTDTDVHNNTCYYGGRTASLMRIVLVSPGVNNASIKNNLGYSPNNAKSLGVMDQGSNSSVSGNSSDAQVRGTEPSFVTVPPTAPADFACTRGYAVGGGVPVPVWSNFGFSPQPSRRNIGAW